MLDTSRTNACAWLDWPDLHEVDKGDKRCRGEHHQTDKDKCLLAESVSVSAPPGWRLKCPSSSIVTDCRGACGWNGANVAGRQDTCNLSTNQFTIKAFIGSKPTSYQFCAMTEKLGNVTQTNTVADIDLTDGHNFVVSVPKDPDASVMKGILDGNEFVIKPGATFGRMRVISSAPSGSTISYTYRVDPGPVSSNLCARKQ